MKDRKKIAVCGATGNQGRAVLQALENSGEWEIIALVRDDSSEPALALSARGISLAVAGFGNQSSLVKAFRNCYAVFVVTQPWDSEKGEYNFERELLHAKNIIWACRLTGVEHVVYSSFINPMNEPTDSMLVNNKLLIESFVREFQPVWTIFRMSLYLENIGELSAAAGVIKGNYDEDLEIPYVALDDLGALVAHAFSEPGLFNGETIDMVGDLISGEAIADLYNEFAPVDNARFKRKLPIWLWLKEPEVYRLSRFFRKFYLPVYLDYLSRARTGLRNFLPAASTARELIIGRLNRAKKT